MLAAAAILLGLPVLMLVLYGVGIQYERGGAWRVCALVASAALVLDVVLNYTLFAVYLWDRPRAGEYTFSKRLERLVHDAGWRGRMARGIAFVLDFLAPSGMHINPKTF